MKPPLTTTDTPQGGAPDTAPSAPVTDNPRLSSLDAAIGETLAYRNFKTTARTMGHPIECDRDLEALEAAAETFFGACVPLNELDTTFASQYAHSWQFYVTLLSSGKLNWWQQKDTAPVVDVPSEDDGNGYFPDEARDPFEEGGEL